MVTNKQEYLYGAKNKKDFLSRLDFIYSIAKASSNLVQGTRQTVPMKWMWKGDAPLEGDRIKLEHVKANVVQEIQSANLITLGKFKELGKEASSDFLGLTAPKSLLDIVDVDGGLVNVSGLYRMALLDPITLQNIVSVKNPKITLFDAIMEKAKNEIFGPKKFKELQKQHKLID